MLRRLYAAVYATFVQRFGPQYPQLQWLKVDAAANYQDILAAQIEKKMVPIIVAAVDGVGNPTLRSLSAPLPSPLASSPLLSFPARHICPHGGYVGSRVCVEHPLARRAALPLPISPTHSAVSGNGLSGSVPKREWP